MKIVQTAGRAALGEFAPEFAHFNDDVLFGENWNNQDIDVKTRSIITVVALMSSGITDSSLSITYRMQKFMVLRRRKLQQSLHMLHFMQVGQRDGQCLTWPKRYGRLTKENFLTKTKQ